jgi:hypothetical protein
VRSIFSGIEAPSRAKRLIGDPSLPLGERLDRVDIIRFFSEEDNRISEQIVQKYQNGQSISDIAKFLSRSKCFVKLRLERAGIEPRESFRHWFLSMIVGVQ